MHRERSELAGAASGPAGTRPGIPAPNEPRQRHMIYEGVRVVDLTHGIAGAYCAKLLTDLGADVVFAEPVADPLFVYLRTSQRHADDPRPWIDAADIVILGEPGHVDGAPPPVTVSITALGHGGPDDALDLPEEVLQARSGSLSAHGHMQLPPLTVGGHLGEYVTGAFAALGAATAWRRASRTHVPEHVDVSMLEAMQLTFVTVPTLMARFPGGRLASFRWVMIPGNEPTADDRYVGITTVTTAQWLALCRAMGREDLTIDDELTTMLGRGLRADEVNAILRAWTTSLDADAIVARCVEARVPATIVGNGAELPRFDHLEAREVFVQQPGEAWIRPRAPFRFHGVEDRVLSAPDVARGPWRPRAAFEPQPLAVGTRPLAGVRVLDFTAFWAGPFATAWLAALGADVIKVEAVQRPDGIRFSATVRPKRDAHFYEKSALFHAVNLGKRGITLDLAHPDGLALAKRLVERSDVVVENFTPRVLEQFGLDYETVRALRDDVVMLRMPAFGLSGPWRDRPGFAQTMEQLTGMAWVTGYEGGPPIIPAGVVDPMVGTHAALALIAALEHRERTGEGQLVEVPLVEVATAVTAEQVIRYSIDGKLFDRRGSQGVYGCAGADEWVAVDRDRDPLDAEQRAEWCATRSPEEAATELQALGVPAAAVVPAYAVLDDAQLRARGFFEPIEHAHVGRHEYPTWPMRMSAGPRRWWTGRAPTLGEHTEVVLRDELGCTDDDLARLRAAHVIGTEPYVRS
jgi:crotonobetainyl-CoA:carnitine CoA-transferase CaiB-like acyl-CoA transferase